MKRTVLSLVTAVCLLTATACSDNSAGSSADGDGGSTVRWATSAMPTSLDPAMVGSRGLWVFMNLIYDTLIDIDVEGNLLPGLATEWAMSEDGTSFDLTLREGVTFSDGEPFDADAVVANFDHLREDGSLVASSLSMVESVEAVDPLHVRLTLNRPGGDLPQVLTGFAGMMVSPASLTAGTTGTEPVGAGPFTLSDLTNSGATFEAWDGYWDADATVASSVVVDVLPDDSARLNALKSGQYDAGVISPGQIAEAESAGLETYSRAGATANGISVNAASNPVLADPDVRRAISSAIDREQISEFLYDGQCAVDAQPYAEGHWAHNDDIDDDEYVSYDPDAARATISAAAPDGLSLKLLTLNITEFQRLAEAVQEQLSEVGIKTEVEALDLADLLARQRKGDYDLIAILFITGDPDPSTWAEHNYLLGPASTEYLDPRIPELIEASRMSVDKAARAEAIGELTQTALEAGTNQIVVCQWPATFAYVDGVTGFEPNDPREMRVP